LFLITILFLISQEIILRLSKKIGATVNIAKNLDLIGGILLAGDGTKLRTQNSKKNNYNQKKIDRHVAYIENKLAEYCLALENADDQKKKGIETKIAKQKKYKKQYQALEKKLKKNKYLLQILK
jgi:flagellar motility protein MotE (MotC chaperone)